MELVKTDTPLQ